MPPKVRTTATEKDGTKQRVQQSRTPRAPEPQRRPAHPANILGRARHDPRSLSPNSVLQLQSALGNRAVTQLLAGSGRPRASGAAAGGTGSAAGAKGLPGGLRAAVENLSGLSLDDVKVHYDSPEPARLGALAYAAGADIHLAPGQERHLPHETWHVVQQKQERVRPTVLFRDAAVNDDHSLESEAERMGAEAASHGPRAGGDEPRPASRPAQAPPVIQGVFTEEEKKRIARLSFGARIKFLSFASQEDLEDYYDSSYHGINPLAAEEADEIRELRKKRVEKGGARAAAREDPEIEALTSGLASLSIGPSDIDELTEQMSRLSLEDRDEDEDVAMELEPISIEKDEYHADGDVVMRNIDGTVDVDMHDVYGSMDVEMSNVEGLVAMDVDHVYGDMDIEISDVQGDVRLTLMDIDLRRAGESSGSEPRYERMHVVIKEVAGSLDVKIYNDADPMDLSFGPVEAGEQVAKVVRKRKRGEPGAETPPAEEGGSAPKRARLEGPEVESVAGEEGSDFGIEELTESFKSLSVSFRSDIDNQMHEIYPAEDYTDIIVESNPTPLKTILGGKPPKWQSILIPGAVVTALTNLQTKAINELKNFGTQRTKAAGTVLRNTMKSIAKQLKGIATAVKLPKADLSGSRYHGSNSGKTEGTYVKADPLSLNATTTGHGPSAESRLMKSIRKAAGKQSKSYKRMHLLNDNVFGPGELWNLTPGPAQSNVDMEKQIETPLKRAILDKGLVMTLEVTVHYPHDPVAASDLDIDQDPNKYRFTKITFKATEHSVDATSGTYKPGANKDADIKAINNATINWKWGSLTPLKAKPKLFDKATTAADLADAGIPKAAANRIHDYVQDPGFVKPVFKGGDKKGQLATLVKNFDGKKTKISTTWDATKVLWS